MKDKTKAIIYFVFIAPILAKVIEWIFQSFSGVISTQVLKQIWFIQIFFIESVALSLFGLFKLMKKVKIYNLSFIVGIAYFLKEIWNFLVVTHVWSITTAFAIIVEPVFMWGILGYLPYKLFFKGSD